MKVLLLDNYDSFTYNLFHYLEGLDCEVDVVLNDQISLGEIDKYDKIILSPGPGLPKASGRLMEVIEHASLNKPILGVCLGFQAIVEFYGGKLFNHSHSFFIISNNQSLPCQQVPNRWHILFLSLHIRKVQNNPADKNFDRLQNCQRWLSP